jgi:hypothetical protein
MNAFSSNPIENDWLIQLKKDQEMHYNKEIKRNYPLIDNFISHALSKGIELNRADFSYIPTIGIVVNGGGGVLEINPDLKVDKEGLVAAVDITNRFVLKRNVPGYFYADNYMAMLHPYFRRGFSKSANYAPNLVEIIWPEFNALRAPSVALDLNRLRIDVNDCIYMELDTWYGAPFTKSITSIPDGQVKITPPLDINNISLFFNNAFALNAKWSTSYGVRNFYMEEIFTESQITQYAGEDWHPARYIHSEYDIQNNTFRHLDGAIHLYSNKDYLARRGLDLNFGQKLNCAIKPRSKKLFKYNRDVTVDAWINYCSHFCSGNPLIHEYFSGKLPENIFNIVDKLRRRSLINS